MQQGWPCLAPPVLNAAGVALPEAANAQDLCLEEAASGLRHVWYPALPLKQS